jgi:Rieske 2Fe-2S family protein
MAFETTLPGRYFYDPGIYAREQERLFGQMWTCVGRADALPEPSDFLTTELAGESILVVRGRDGDLRAFLNVCRHRGARLSLDACGHLGGAIQCPYHAWSYALDGRLIGAPNIARDETLDKERLGLIPVHLAVWEGLIWLSLADDPGPVSAQLEPALLDRFGELEKFRRYDVGSLAVGRSIAYEIAANWKLVVENFMECYHCAPVHPELTSLLPAFRLGTSYQGILGQGTAFADEIDAFTLSGAGDRPMLPGLLPSDARLYYGFVLWPNLFVNLLPDHVILHTLTPLGPERSRVVCDWLFTPKEAARPGFDPSDTVAVFDITNRQDWDVCERTQLGMRSRAYANGGFYVTNEQHIATFRDLVLDRIAEPTAMSDGSHVGSQGILERHQPRS